MPTTTETKPQAAIDLGLLSRSEAAEYMGMSYQTFAKIAKNITAVRLGDSGKYYSLDSIKAYLAKIQQEPKKDLQGVGN